MSKKKGIATRSPEGLVLDCSIVMAWYFVDESSEYADEVARRLPQQAAFVPLNWPLEVANVLFMGERRKRSTQTSPGINASLHPKSLEHCIDWVGVEPGLELGEQLAGDRRNVLHTCHR